MNPLALFQAPYRYVLEALVVAAMVMGLCLYGLHLLHQRDAAHEAAGAARVQAQWDHEKTIQQAAALKAQADHAAEVARVQAENERITNEHQKTIAAMAADRDSARRAVEQLRARIASITAGTGASGGGLPKASSPAADSSPASTLGNLLGTCAQRYQELAASADTDHAAGNECEQRYDALMPKP